jgi:hypothetical protein
MNNYYSTTIMGFWNNMWNGVKRVAGSFGNVVRGVGSFTAKHHPTMALVASGLANMSGNESLKKAANFASMASNAYTTRQNLDKFNAQRAAGGGGFYDG